MKRMSLTLVLILVISLLCGCTKTPPPATTAPPLPTESIAPTETASVNFCPAETTVPPETTSPLDPTAPSVEDFSEYEALLDFSTEPNWLPRTLGCIYEKPEDIDLYYMFYLGAEHPGSWDDISAESRQSLIDQGFITEMELQIMPAEKLEDALQSTFGIGLDDVTIPGSWGYIEAEDAYCSNHSDAYFPGVPVITAVEDDGMNIRIHYTIDGFWDYTAGEILDTANLILGLKRQDGGGIHAVFNIFVP